MPPPQTSILHSPSPHTLLIDIPLSLSLAQHLSPPPHLPPPPALLPHHSPPPQPLPLLLSSPAPSHPYPTTEPKSSKARHRVLEHVGPPIVNEEWLAREWDVLRQGYEGNWCEERRIGVDSGGKRKRGEVELDFRGFLSEDGGGGIYDSVLLLEDIGGGGRDAIIAVDRILHRPVCNAQDYTVRCTVSCAEQRGATYLLPPRSTFLLSTITAGTASAFTDAALRLLPETTASAGPGQFDFILLDPPWSNRSVRRSRRYDTMESRGADSRERTDPMKALGMLGQHIAPGGLVGCWITNKLAVRKMALAAFEDWGVDLIEEWVWLKVTSKGQPVTELGGVWRKPYEVLLLGRKVHHEKHGDVEAGVNGADLVMTRLIVAVPDLHSRKPSLKELVEPLLQNPRHYRALEVFARNLTAGWWAWGDECLKYNWNEYWTSDFELPPQT